MVREEKLIVNRKNCITCVGCVCAYPETDSVLFLSYIQSLSINICLHKVLHQVASSGIVRDEYLYGGALLTVR